MKHRLVITLALMATSVFAVGPTIPPNPWEEDAPIVHRGDPKECPNPDDGPTIPVPACRASK